jgi:enoyl-CoA hydratase/carnithine racemase
MGTVDVERLDDGIVILRMNRPEVLNAIDRSLLDGFEEALTGLRHDDRVVILTGRGGAFCAGADLKAADSGAAVVPERSDESQLSRIWAAQERLTGIALALHRLRQPVIAAIDGVAVGGGFGWALASDVRIGSTRARMGAVFMKIGLSNIDVGTSYFLPRIVGAGRASELMLTARIIDAQQAERIGLLNEVVPPDELLDRAVAVAREIAAHSPFGVWMTKVGVQAGIDAPSLDHAVQFEYRTQMMGVYHDDMSEAVDAFTARRPPVWKSL